MEMRNVSFIKQPKLQTNKQIKEKELIAAKWDAGSNRIPMKYLY